ncbi:acyl carrier protein [Anabaena sp. UHCC 0187]|jgi:acyl carrier protein|uniref:acyl carrier protein n=1 Tax=Anabaena sp. UHCC 0187 TaxID=2590018 RepID=UPI0014478E64|nr:acyl carrier protein [Anabaena sp. UHCC 0187]MTJ13946.1 acyl carrier protein [Anabaena sp. UHCC 0187]
MKMPNQEIIAEKQQTVTAIQAWLVSYLSQLLEIDQNEVNVTTSFDRYGLDSSATIGLTTDLGDWLGRSIDPTITYDYPSIESLSEHLSGS